MFHLNFVLLDTAEKPVAAPKAVQLATHVLLFDVIGGSALLQFIRYRQNLFHLFCSENIKKKYSCICISNLKFIFIYTTRNFHRDIEARIKVGRYNYIVNLIGVVGRNFCLIFHSVKWNNNDFMIPLTKVDT